MLDILVTPDNPDKFLTSNFCRVLYVVRFLLGNSPASEFYMPTFQNTLSVPSSWTYRKFRCRGVTQKKTYNNPEEVVLNIVTCCKVPTLT